MQALNFKRMNFTIYQVDAFAEKIFEGNPAAVVPLETWLPDDVMQNVAFENNLSETAFFIPWGNGYHIRWFTPGAEVDLCGHATLATAHVLFQHLNYLKDEILFESRSGRLIVKKEDDLIVLDFPSSTFSEIEIPENLKDAFSVRPLKCFSGRDDLMLLFENENDIYKLEPDFQKITKSKTRGIITTTKSEKYDFISRFFAPAVGVNEDPVTGSAHTMLIPFWAEKLGTTQLLARQVSTRGGNLYCKYLGDRVEIGGKAITFLVGEIGI